ncbi:quinon protein alcohol dehydrogenase-like superfamily [Rhypophila decipiens]|uniref:Quinon protein alcohol dehydrogenase-like superfamily n=1 Tax=Rhypophila decipiens TaxID=261697 RepID=A0AAN6XYJ9_9PEZI|nr:quinon protein alcohol dehydrogenase-like superfamily [Rhypophila decipiens]
MHFSLPSLIALISSSSAAAAAAASSSSVSSWSGWGGNIFNNRWTASKTITPSNINSLTQHCQLVYPFGVSATPVVYNNTAYYPTWNGSIVALDYTTCRVQWTVNVTAIVYNYRVPTPDVLLATFPLSRTSPQISGHVLFFGTQMHALLVAVNRHTGAFLDLIQIHSHPYAVLTTSPTVYKDTVMLGTASLEEPSALFFPNYTCCTFIGSFAAVTFPPTLNKFKLRLKWSLSMVPPGSGFSGAAVWGSQPSISPADKNKKSASVFFATGNIYSFPPQYAHCASPSANISCLPSNIYQNSILSVDISTGKVRWAYRTSPMDAFNGACVTSPIDTQGCPSEPPGPDADFAMAPVYVRRTTSPGSFSSDVVITGQKNTAVYALDANTGRPYWVKIIRPALKDVFQGGALRWGIAVDDERIYYTLGYSKVTAANVSSSIYGALELSSGKILWEKDSNTPLGKNSIALNPGTVQGDLLFVPRTGDLDGTGSFLASKGGLVVLDTKQGRRLLERELDVMFQGGIAVVGEYVLFGTGYRNGVVYDYRGTGSFHVWKVVTGRPRHGKE